MRALAPLLVLLAAACNAPQVCVPGRSEACAGPGGCSGGQRCNEEGSAFEACVCAASDAGVAPSGFDAGAVATDGGFDGAGRDAGPDAGERPDAGAVDGGTCNPVAQTGCEAGEKCTWVRVAEAPEPLGKVGCVPAGAAGLGAVCAQGPVGETTGYDDCDRGLVCINSSCATVCDLSVADGCGTTGVCTRYAGLFSNGEADPIAGACTATCNPVTQEVSTGGTCGAGRGCYLLTSATTTVAVCAGAGTVLHGQDIVGTAFANSCVPGAQPRRKSPTSQVVECGMLCAPADVTASTNVASEGGVAPDSCVARSAGSPTPAAPPDDPTEGESCRYYWAREPFTELSPYSNTVGWCFKHAVFTYDSNGDQVAEAPFPRCTTLTVGDVVPPILNPPGNDALEFWCLQAPATRGLVPLRIGRTQPSAEPLLDRIGGWRR